MSGLQVSNAKDWNDADHCEGFGFNLALQSVRCSVLRGLTGINQLACRRLYADSKYLLECSPNSSANSGEKTFNEEAKTTFCRADRQEVTRFRCDACRW